MSSTEAPKRYRFVTKNGSGWTVRISKDGVLHRFGTYRTIEEAHAVAEARAAELLGDRLRAVPQGREGFRPNSCRVQGDLAFLEITDVHGQKVAESVMDAADAARVLATSPRWMIGQAGGKKYVRATIHQDGKNACVYLHRLIADAPAGMVVDHINGETLDNRRVNLRVATIAQNIQNSHGNLPRKSNLPRNVYRSGRPALPFKVAVRANGVRHECGRFRTLEEATAAAERARIAYQTHCPENSPKVPEVSR